MTLRELKESGWLADENLAEARQWLCQDREEEKRLPWIARFSLGLGAWFAGIFMIAFLVLLLDDGRVEDGVGYLAVGLVILAIGIAVIRLRKNIFLDQLALVLSFAGYGMASIGAEEMWPGYSEFHGALVLSLLLCPLVYWLSGHVVLRFMSVGWSWFAFLGFAFSDESLGIYLAGLSVGLAFVVVALSGRIRMRRWRPALLSTLFGLFTAMWVMSVETHGYRDPFFREAYPAIGTVMVLGFSCLLWWLERGSGTKSTLAVAVFALVAGTIGYFGGPGVGVALGLMAVAHARRDPWLSSIAVIALTGFLILFYYYLGVSLMTKSLSLMATGAATLVLCAVVTKNGKNPKPSTEPAA
ncbi:MAG: DUF4401 domain-containing protein [Verrucomicrobiales bacterium]|nr:DUF4401 domain-containing protein [Verrucomicrobiales bacterium]